MSNKQTDIRAIYKGDLYQFDTVQKFGKNAAVPNGSFAPIVLGGDLNFLTAADTVRVKAGGNAADTAAGAGARSVTIQGLDANGIEISETVATAGASASSSTARSFLRVYRAWVETAGTYGSANTGLVTIESTGGTELIEIGAEEGQTQFCCYTIPAGYNAYIMGLFASVDAGKAADIAVYTRNDITTTSAPVKAKRLKYYIDGLLGDINIESRVPIATLDEMTDVWVEAQGSGAITEASANLEIVLIES